MWQATARPVWVLGGFNAGSRRSQTGSAKTQRVRNRHPDGGLIGFGGSPVSGGATVR